jgi:hypothetical protein
VAASRRLNRRSPGGRPGSSRTGAGAIGRHGAEPYGVSRFCAHRPGLESPSDLWAGQSRGWSFLQHLRFVQQPPWIPAVGPSLLLLTDAGVVRPPTTLHQRACSSSGARAVQRAVPTPASCAQARVRVSRLTPLQRAVQGARRAAPHRHLILRAPRSHPARAIACERTPTRSATRFRTPKRGSGPRVPGPPRRRIRPVSVRRRAGSRG